MSPYAHRVDANQAVIVAALRDAGCSVAITSMVGGGFPDLVVARNGKMWLMEVKDGEKPPSARKLTKDEQDFHDTWKADVHIVNDIDEALEVVNKE